MSMKITDEIFESYVNCKYKAYLKFSGKGGNKSDYERLENELQGNFESVATGLLLAPYADDDVFQADLIMLSDLRKGKEVILSANLEYSDLSASFHALVKVSGKSMLGSFHYLPILFSASDEITKVQKLLLAFQAYVIGSVQNQIPLYAQVIYGSAQKRSRVRVEPLLHHVQRIIQEIRKQQSGEAVAKILLNHHCQICEFQDSCRAKAREEDNLSLLTRLSEREIKEQNNKGIFTVTQYSYTFRPRKRSKGAKNKSTPHFSALKALAIRENKIYVYEKPELPASPVSMYWDIEGDLKQSFSYLIGLVIVSSESINHHTFWAEDEQQEEHIFNQFLQVLSRYTDYCIFHYGSYETSFLKRMKKQLGEENKQRVEEILNKSINLLSIIYSRMYFPTYSNSLKDIGKYLGFQWTSAEGSGIQSWVWRKRWEMTGDGRLKEMLIQYNLDDCLALKRVTELVYQIFDNSCAENLNGLEVAHAQNVKQDSNYGFQRPAFSSPDLEYINKCSYFDYQREKVLVRTNGRLKEIQAQEKRKAKRAYKINKRILIETDECPSCGSSHLYSQSYSKNKVVFDLKFSRGGVKKWVIQYSTFQYQCKQCRKSFVPIRYKNVKQIYEHGLVSWCIYQYVVNRQSYEQIQRTLSDVFSISVPLMSIYDFKTLAVSKYQETYESLITKITSSNLMHCDETSIRLQKDKGYVWVFTNMEEAAYIYKPTREGEFLHDLLKDFKGVLVSDFYSAYDSIDCPQQKCLVHLIRDLNNNLFHNPFDEEFKDLVRSFTLVLREIIDTVDRFGLKKRNLKKHKGEVEKFFCRMANRRYNSELAGKFQKRFKKNVDKLFTFLDYDGVPWNNNYAEHAIKVFAHHRKLVNGRVTEAGIKDYLVLLSIYQTCRYKGLSFLDFLLSKETSTILS